MQALHHPTFPITPEGCVACLQTLLALLADHEVDNNAQLRAMRVRLHVRMHALRTYVMCMERNAKEQQPIPQQDRAGYSPHNPYYSTRTSGDYASSSATASTGAACISGMNGIVDQQELLAHVLSARFTNLLAGAALQSLLHMSPSPPMHALYATRDGVSDYETGSGWSISGEDRLSILQEHAALLDVPLGDGAGTFTRDINIHLKLPLPILSLAEQAEIAAQRDSFHQSQRASSLAMQSQVRRVECAVCCVLCAACYGMFSGRCLPPACTTVRPVS